MLAYLAGWVTGLLFYVIERDDKFVRFHAAQAIVTFGSLTLLVLFLVTTGFVLLFVSATGFQLMLWLSQIVTLAGLIIWAICLFKAFSGDWFKLPMAGELAAKIAEK
jgi:uncharacterized membrane protein